ncbi:MAG: ornithine cyclodeaminase, partial [Phycisphaerae bacterium]
KRTDASPARRSDRREAAINEAGDFLLAKQEGAVGNDHIVGEIGQVVAGDMQGRTSDREVTMFKSVGLAVEDLAAAALVYEKARASDAAARVSLGGRRYGTR